MDTLKTLVTNDSSTEIVAIQDRVLVLLAVIPLPPLSCPSEPLRPSVASESSIPGDPYTTTSPFPFNDQLTEISAARTEITLEVLAANLTKIDLDFGEMPIDAVTVSGSPARFERKPDLLDVFLERAAKRGDKLNLTVNYHGRPKDGLIFAKDRDGKPSATGDNWPNRVHQWIPCLDHPSAKATVSFTVAAPPRELVVANGKFVTMTRNGNAPSLWRFDETKPIPAYCMVIAVSEGAKIDANEPTVTPLSYYVPQERCRICAEGICPPRRRSHFSARQSRPIRTKNWL